MKPNYNKNLEKKKKKKDDRKIDGLIKIHCNHKAGLRTMHKKLYTKDYELLKTVYEKNAKKITTVSTD